MKLSIWQQFSSNHSNSFTIIGQFASEVETNDAAKRLRKILSEMLVNSEAENGNELVKQQIESLGLAWTHEKLPDWLVPEMLDIDSYWNMLFVDNGGNSDSAPEPLGMLLDRLGCRNTVLRSEWAAKWDSWNCEFDILDAAQADAFEAMITDLLTMSLEAYWAKEKETLLSTEMWWLVWRKDFEGIAVEFRRIQNHFQIQKAFFWFIIPHAKVLILFTSWLEECGASNIQYTARN